MYDCLPTLNITPQYSLETHRLGFIRLPKLVPESNSKRSSSGINSARNQNATPFHSDLAYGEIRLKRDQNGENNAPGSGIDEEAEDMSIGDILEIRAQKKDDKLVEQGSHHRRSSRRQMTRRSNLLAKQVISIRSALSLGFVSQLWVDTSSWVVMVVELKPNLLSGDFERFLLKEIKQVGDVMLVEDENVVEDDIKFVGLETMVGYTVVTPSRQSIGKVRGYTFNINSGTVESLELDSFGISIIPSSLVSTYALLVEDVVEVSCNTVVVHEAAMSRVHRLTKGFWDGQNDRFEEQLENHGKQDRRADYYTEKRRRKSSGRKSRPKISRNVDDWELPMDYL